MDRQRSRPAMRIAATGAVVLGLAAGSYGVASAATGSGSSPAAGSDSTAVLGTLAAGNAAGTAQQAAPRGWGTQRSDETLLAGDTAAKVQAAAVAKVGSGATVSRVETDADGHAAYEVHMVRQDGTLVTVYVDKSFDVVSVETGMRAPGQPGA